MQGHRKHDDPRIVLNRRGRDALYRQLELELDGWGAPFSLDDPAEAQRERRQHEAFFALLDDLGWWEHDDRETFVLTMPADRLEPVLRRFRDGNAEHVTYERRQREQGRLVDTSAIQAQAEASIDEALEIIHACDSALAQIEGRR